MFRRIVLLVSMCLVVMSGIAVAQDAKKEKAAVSSAQKWLTAVDEGKYGESWQEAASYFKHAVSKEQWKQSLQAVRKPLGKLVTRYIQSAAYTRSLPGALTVSM